MSVSYFLGCFWLFHPTFFNCPCASCCASPCGSSRNRNMNLCLCVCMNSLKIYLSGWRDGGQLVSLENVPFLSRSSLCATWPFSPLLSFLIFCCASENIIFFFGKNLFLLISSTAAMAQRTIMIYFHFHNGVYSVCQPASLSLRSACLASED